MNGEPSPAVIAAQQAQARVEQCLAERNSFRLEAGAGAGKTFSLVAALKKIIAEQGPALVHAGKRVACITYTEVARQEIANEVEEHPAILVNTIHSFGWAFISRFQKELRALVAAQEARHEAIESAGGIADQIVEYSFGFFGIDESRITLSHDDVPQFLGSMLANTKFKRIFESLFPIVFIDEYQDTDPAVMGSMTEHFFTPNTGPVVGLFGDHWQTIYRKDYQLLDFPNVEGIDKGSNFRSVPAIVDVLNRLRPELQQEVDDPDAQGEARFFHCNDFGGQRGSSAHASEELPQDDWDAAVERMTQRLVDDGWNMHPDKTKILMLTHNTIAAKRGYQNLARIFERKEAFAKKEDAAIAFLADTVEPICSAYSAGNFGEMFRIMGKAPTIHNTGDKAHWRADMDALVALRAEGTIGQVIDHLKETRRPRLPDRVSSREEEIAANGPEPIEGESGTVRRHRLLREVQYQELVEVTAFVNGSTPFATKHSVKGAEFENVLVVLSGGWNQYHWPRFLSYLHTGNVTAAHQAGYYRARNLFYVSISRPKIRLAVLATQRLDANAVASATMLFGEENVSALPMNG